MHYYAGQFLAQQGNKEKSHKYLMLSATSPIRRSNPHLAAAQLLVDGVELTETRVKEQEK